MILNDEIRQSIEESVLCWLATVDAHGNPNVSPKEVFVADGADHLLIANIASPNSVRNIEINPAVCISFVHVFKQKGFKLKGVASILQPGDPAYAEKHRPLYAIAGERFPIQSIIQIRVTNAQRILAPSYRLYPDTTEAGQIADAMETYGVSPRGGT